MTAPQPIVILLRGINVGRANRIRMADLREVVAGQELDGVGTYIQSGNLVARDPAGRSPAHLEPLIEDAVSRAFGLSIAVFIRTHDELGATVQGLPDSMAGHDPRHLYVGFLKRGTCGDGALDPDRSPADRVAGNGREVFVAYATGASRSKLTPAYLEKALGSPMTMRNWNTVTRLVEMSSRSG